MGIFEIIRSLTVSCFGSRERSESPQLLTQWKMNDGNRGGWSRVEDFDFLILMGLEGVHRVGSYRFMYYSDL